ncbi:hypothetical protein LC048_07770 [Mesobacillus subterraneus]|uniref:hypothetical protein n=1 Tax=Mesobacillus subterraneus TaxID=285983 RepID=UPI00273DCFDC|nr:hypothetical protein [Mesobacillus subterraneus]WLR56767.1 hypothetical protein LC048_07770 [Mesobacillus subterraneus]
MSIRQYYLQTAYISLNGSIISAGFLTIILTASLLFSWNIPLFLVAVPFLLFVFLHYNRFILYKNKSEESAEAFHRYDDKQLLEQNNLLIGFAPAPAVRLLFFTPDGMLAGELRELSSKSYRWFIPYFLDKKIMKKIGIFDSEGNLEGCLIQERNRFKILTGNKDVIGVFYPKKAAKETIGFAFLSGGRKMKVDRITGAKLDLKFIQEGGRTAARLQRGWLPLEWTRFFKEANTPVLTFDYTLGQAERLAVLAAVASAYMYYDH